jgi:hypothetical protein
MQWPLLSLSSRLRRFAVVLLLPLLASASAAPTNDGFATPVELSGAPVSQPGDNTDASLEPDEWNPGDSGGASVWYRWIAPGGGWYEVTTRSEDPEHDLDTVVALFVAGVSGNLVDAEALGYNDDSSSFGGLQSRLVFFAAAGTDYRIAVHGYDGETGGFLLAINPVPPPPAMITSVEFSPAAVDVGSDLALTTVTVGVRSASPLEGGVLTLFPPDVYAWLGGFELNEESRISGSALEGVYQGVIAVQAYRSPGLYPLQADLWTQDEDHVWSPTGRDWLEDHYLLPSGGRLQVNNTGQVDATGPSLVSLTGLPAVVDLSDGDVEVSVTAGITDDLAGFRFAEIVLLSADDDWEIGYFDDDTLVDGTLLDGAHEAEVRFGNGLPLGTYWVVVELQDLLGNRSVYGGPDGEALPDGVPATIVLTGTPPPNDDFANRIVLGADLLPVVSGTTVLASKQPGEPDFDDQVRASVWYEWTAAASEWVSLEVSAGSGSRWLGLFTGEEVTGLAEVGRNSGGPLVFLASAGQTYQIGVFLSRGSADGPFELTLQPLAAPPALRVMQVSVTPGQVDVGAGSQSVWVELAVQSDSPLLEDSAGFTSLSAALNPDPSVSGLSAVTVWFDPTHRISGTTINGVYRREITLPPFVEPADWFLTVRGNLVGKGSWDWSAQGNDPIHDRYLIPAGSGTVEVSNTGLVDTEAPVLTSFEGLPASLNLSGGSVEVTLTLVVEDDISGFESAFITFYAPGSFGGIYVVGSVGAPNQISGDANSGVYQINYTFGALIPPGEYAFEVSLRDFSGNTRNYGPLPWYDPFPPGSVSTVMVGNDAAGYLGWAAVQDFGPSGRDGPLEDANDDGVSNLLCYAFNISPYGEPARVMTPNNGDLSGLPAISVVGEGSERRLRVEFVRRFTEGNQLSYRVQFGSDPDSDMQDFTGPFEITFIDSDWLRLVALDPVADADRRFARVRVDLQ